MQKNQPYRNMSHSKMYSQDTRYTHFHRKLNLESYLEVLLCIALHKLIFLCKLLKPTPKNSWIYTGMSCCSTNRTHSNTRLQMSMDKCLFFEINKFQLNYSNSCTINIGTYSDIAQSRCNTSFEMDCSLRLWCMSHCMFERLLINRK